MTVEEAAEILGLTPQRVRVFCREGRLGQRVGRQWVITEEELERFQSIPRLPGVSTGRPRDNAAEHPPAER
jgi:excisionase family DNA binding protein